MINGFEEYTYSLSDYELSLVPGFVKSFSARIGKENAIKTNQIVLAFSEKGKTMSPARVRKIVNYIRREGLVKRLAATSKGYYVEPNDKAWKENVESMYQRAEAIREVADALSNQ